MMNLAVEMGHASAQLAADRAGQEWQDKALHWLKYYVQDHAEFQCYHVRGFAENKGLPTPPDDRSWGAIMLKASRMGIIKATNVYLPTEHTESHGRPQRVWQSLISI